MFIRQLKKRYLILSSLIACLFFYPLIGVLTRGGVVWRGGSGGNELNDDPAIMVNPSNFKQDPLFREDLNKNYFNGKPGNEDDDVKIKIPYRLVHLDLKGAPPKLSYLRSLLKLFKDAGANGLLIEYEDYFDYKSANISSLHPYDRNELRSFLKEAIALDFEIIPLIQTFGHLEYLLKLREHSSLREVAKYPNEICPSNDKAVKMVMQLLKEVVDFHNDIKKLNYVHIGCDEVWHLGLCDKCRGKEIKDLFLGHVETVARGVGKWGLRAIIWDDMIRKLYNEDLVKSRIGEVADLMVWDYTEDVDRLINPFLWPMYTASFPNIWVASAFKGAFGESLYLANEKRHALNQLSWLKTVKRELPQIKNFRGFAVTGWSRYDHFSVLCELLPPSIPSLVIALSLIEAQKMDLTKPSSLLKCELSSLENVNLDYCSWPGNDLYQSLVSLSLNERSVKELLDSWSNSGKGWLTDYNYHHNSTSLWRLEEALSTSLSYNDSLRALKVELRERLSKYFEKSVVNEWLVQRVDWIRTSLDNLQTKIKALSKRKYYPRRD